MHCLNDGQRRAGRIGRGAAWPQTAPATLVSHAFSNQAQGLLLLRGADHTSASECVLTGHSSRSIRCATARR